MVKVRIPATTANLGCGYDAFGMALGYYNYVTVEPADKFKLIIIGEGEKHLHTENNLVVRSANAAYDLAGIPWPQLSFVCENNITLSRGMGSSSAAIVGGIFAANELMGGILTAEQMLELAIKIEGHPDNVTPALYGGFTVSVSEGAEHFAKKVSVPASLRAVLAVPKFTVSTKKARAIMPKEVPLADAVYNISHAAYLALSLQQGDISGFGAMLSDKLHQPYRFGLIKGAEDVVDAAIAAGALGCVISGSGPTMISFTEDDDLLQDNIAAAMSEAFANHDVSAKILTMTTDNQGATKTDS
jgi:homoserine kinase